MPCALILIILIPTIVCVTFLSSLALTLDLNKLWTEQGGRSEMELDYIDRAQNINSTVLAKVAILATIDREGGDVFTIEHLVEHEIAARYVTDMQFEMKGRNWTVVDFCVKAAEGELTTTMQLVKDIYGSTPYDACLKISPLDCFSEGGIWHGDRPQDRLRRPAL
jgi:hypothetical protein